MGARRMTGNGFIVSYQAIDDEIMECALLRAIPSSLFDKQFVPTNEWLLTDVVDDVVRFVATRENIDLIDSFADAYIGGISWDNVPDLSATEELALDTALSLVLSSVPKFDYSPLFMTMIELGVVSPVVWQPFEDFSKDDLVNTIWQFQEAIHETIMKANGK
jgi:hypothetical protein